MPKAARHFHITPSKTSSLAPEMCWPLQPQKTAAFTAPLRVRSILRVRLEKTTSLELQGHWTYERDAQGCTALPQHGLCTPSTWNKPCTHHLSLSKRLLFLLHYGTGLNKGLLLKKTDTPELQEHCSYKNHT